MMQGLSRLHKNFPELEEKEKFFCDGGVTETPTPHNKQTPHSHSSLSDGHKFMGFFRNRIAVVEASTRLVHGVFS
jgi:hypothetical protein